MKHFGQKFSFGIIFLVIAGLMAVVGENPALAAPSLLEINPPKSGDSNRLRAIVGATLIDTRNGAVVTGSVVLVRGTKIAEVGRVGATVIPPGAEVFNAEGLTMLPGFIDSHFHIERDYEMPRIVLSHGVTSVRDPGQWIHVFDPVRKSDRIQPRCFVAGPHLDCPPPAHPADAWLVTNAQDVVTAVNRFVDDGASVIKCYFRLPRDLIAVACNTAHQRGVPVTAHLELIDADEAIRAGLDGIEHVTSFGTALAEPDDATQFRAAVQRDNEERRKERYWLWSRLDLDHSPRVKPLLDLIVSRGVFVSATLAVFERRAGDRGATEMEARAFTNMLKFVGMCHRRGARIVVGSHTAVPHAERGWAYQRELELLEEAGLTRMEVIQAATLQNARYFQIEDRLGAIEPQKTADLVLFERNPLNDARAFRKIHRAMLNGSWVE